MGTARKYTIGGTVVGPMAGHLSWARATLEISRNGALGNILTPTTRKTISAIITDANGFDYLADDHEGNTTYASLLGVTAGTTVFDEGIIERNTDLDYFAFATAPGTISLDIDPFYRGPNLDILATLYDASGVALATSNPTGVLNATFNMSVDGGTYFFSVDGTGEGDLTSGYSDYGSLGYYSISGTILNSDLPGTHKAAVSLADTITDLDFGNWSNVAPVIADQTFSVAENSTDGTVVGTLAATDANSDSLFYNITSNADPDADGNAAFRVEGDQLLVNDADDFDYETNPQLVITVEASDGSLTDTATLTVDLTAVNEAPEFSYPDPQSVAEDTDLVFSAAGGNPLGLSDEDAGRCRGRVCGSRQNYGLLTLPETTGLTFMFGSSNGSHSITGPRHNRRHQHRARWLHLQPAGGVPRCGHTQPHCARPGPGVAPAVAQMSVATVEIAINPVNDAPQLTVPTDQTTPVNTTLFFSAANDNAIQGEDVDAGTAEIGTNCSASPAAPSASRKPPASRFIAAATIPH